MSLRYFLRIPSSQPQLPPYLRGYNGEINATTRENIGIIY
jgi:hypothetical protein